MYPITFFFNFFFFKQKTAYEMRISDWSSDVCSSDLYVSALSIADLVRSGKRVAVASNSHKAIGNLLKAVAQRAQDQGLACSIAQKVSDAEDADDHPAIIAVTDNNATEIGAVHVVGSTAWHFARYDTPAFDYLFVDEAGPVPPANLLAMGPCAHNIRSERRRVGKEGVR